MPNLSRQAMGTKEFVALMATIMSVIALSIDAILPALVIIGEDLSIDQPNNVQFIISAIFAGMAVGQLICGPLSDALGRKRLLIISFLAYLVGSVICLSARSFEYLLVGRLLQGFAAAGPYVSTLSIVRDRFQGSAMARMMSFVMTIFIMVPVIAPSIGQLILYFASWRYIFLLLFCYGCGILLWTVFRLEETLPVEQRIPFTLENFTAGVTTVFSNRNTVCYLLCSGLVMGMLIGYLNSCLQVFQDLYAVGKEFALYFGGLAFTLGLASLFNAQIVQRSNPHTICSTSLKVVVGASGIFILILSYASAPLWLFIMYMSVLFFCFGLLFGNLNALAMEPMGHIAGLASAIIGALSFIVSITAGTMIGQYYDFTLFPLTTGFLVLSVMALCLLYWAKSPTPEETENEQIQES